MLDLGRIAKIKLHEILGVPYDHLVDQLLEKIGHPLLQNIEIHLTGSWYDATDDEPDLLIYITGHYDEDQIDDLSDFQRSHLEHYDYTVFNLEIEKHDFNKK